MQGTQDGGEGGGVDRDGDEAAHCPEVVLRGAGGGGGEDEGVDPNKGDEGGGQGKGLREASFGQGGSVGVKDGEEVGARQEARDVRGRDRVDGMSEDAVENPKAGVGPDGDEEEGGTVPGGAGAFDGWGGGREGGEGGRGGGRGG